MTNLYIEYADGQKHALEGAETSNDNEHYKDCGRVIDKDEIVIDIDNLEHSIIDKIIKTFNIKTEYHITDRGIHLVYIKNDKYKPKAKGICPLGFEIEQLYSPSKQNHCVKRNGVARKVYNEGRREKLPFIFSIGKYDNLQGLSENEGRNSSLFNHRCKIHTSTTETEMLKIIEFVNDNIFSDPLPLGEILTITRDNLKFDIEQSSPTDIGRHLIKEWGIVEYYDSIWFKDKNDIYITDDKYLKYKILNFYNSAKTSQVDEIFKQIDTLSNNEPFIEKINKEFPIKFKNGLLKQGQFIEVDYQDFTPYYIDINYNPDAEPVKIVDDYIDHLVNYDEDYKKIIFEMIGHIFITDKDFKRLLSSFFIIVGKAGAGKGTLLTLIRNIVGANNTTGLDIAQLSDEKYYMSMKKKLVNLGDDISDHPINNDQMKLLKNISTCDNIQGRELYKQSESITLSNTLIFTSNHILKSFEKGRSYQRRVKWLPIVNEVRDEDKRDIMSELMEEKALEYFIRLSIEGYFRLYKNKKLTSSDFVNKWNEDYHQENDNVTIFLSEHNKEEFIGRKPLEVHEDYLIWAIENDYTDENNRSYNKKRLKEMIEERFDLEVSPRRDTSGKNRKVYVEK